MPGHTATMNGRAPCRRARSGPRRPGPLPVPCYCTPIFVRATGHETPRFGVVSLLFGPVAVISQTLPVGTVVVDTPGASGILRKSSPPQFSFPAADFRRLVLWGPPQRGPLLGRWGRTPNRGLKKKPGPRHARGVCPPPSPGLVGGSTPPVALRGGGVLEANKNDMREIGTNSCQIFSLPFCPNCQFFLSPFSTPFLFDTKFPPSVSTPPPREVVTSRISRTKPWRQCPRSGLSHTSHRD